VITPVEKELALRIARTAADRGIIDVSAGAAVTVGSLDDLDTLQQVG
jgi:hypothetical protein